MNKKYSIAVDFDGVIHQYISPWVDSMVIVDPPIPGVFQWLTEMVEKFNIVIHTCRLKQHNGPEHLNEVYPPQMPDEVKAVRAAIKLWFLEHGLAESVVEQLIFWTKPGKPTALVYIDDRGYRFEGKLPTEPDIRRKLWPWKYAPPPPARKPATDWDYAKCRNKHEGPANSDTCPECGEEWSGYNPQSDAADWWPTCDHQPDEHTFSYSGSDLIIDVNCRACGMSGSFRVEPSDINWE